MKELTIEEKAERYDEVLSMAKEWYNNPNSSSIGKSYLYAVFPELKESEGERVKKDIKRAISVALDYCYFNKETANNCLAWIEKQDKKIDAIENFDTEFEKQISRLIASIINKDYEYTKDFVKWTSNALLNYAKYEIEKQGEQKPTIEMITPEESLGVDSDTYNKIVDECIYGERKPTWSEEDENRFNNLIFLVEFSDENKATKEGFIKFINKLKSLRPQNRWKPSESDILLLEKIANGKSNPQDFQASLWGLIGQLKKLRE